MDNKNGIPVDMNLPWYDDRTVETACEEGCEEDDTDWVYKCFRYDTPKRIYEFLDQRMYKQEMAKKEAAIIAFKCFERGIKSNAMFVGPSGCGKTFIWRLLKKIFPDRIEIVDGSNVTLDGWQGGKKWSNLLSSPIFRSGKHTILVIDEADKMLAPKYARGGENVSQSVQSEGLAMMEGTYVDIKADSATYKVSDE